MNNLDGLLYKWIQSANLLREDLDLPVGIIEESVALLKQVLGSDYLEELLIANTEPVHFLDDEANPLRKWLLSAIVEQHVIQVLELASYFKSFIVDAALPCKVERLKRHSFWPMFFELAMATRLKRASRAPQKVYLNPEIETSVGDFMVGTGQYDVPCECSRLGRTPAITEPDALREAISNRIGDATKQIVVPLCIKIRSTEALTGAVYNRVLQLLRKGLADARISKLPSEQKDGPTAVAVEVLTDASEKVPFRMIDGEITNVLGSDWDSAERLCRVPAKNSDELAGRYQHGEKFHEYESVRVFNKFGAPTDQIDHYDRLTKKLKKKLQQTKISAGHFGKVALIEVPFDLQTADTDRLKAAVRRAVTQSHTTLAVILANRQPTLQFRYHYGLAVTVNQTAVTIQPQLGELFQRAAQTEATVDPIPGSPYRRSWAEAQELAKKRQRIEDPAGDEGEKR